MVDDQEIQQILREGFEEEKTSFFRPPVDGPFFDTTGTAYISLLENKIHENPDFAKKLSEFEDLRVISRGIPIHEFGHYFFFPRKVSLALFLSYNASKDFGIFANNIYQMYLDFVNEAMIVQQDMGSEEIKKTRIAMFNSASLNQLNPISACYYLSMKEKMGLSIQVDLGCYEHSTLDKIVQALDQISKIIINPEISGNDMDEYFFYASQQYIFGEALLPLLKDQLNQELKALISCMSQDHGLITKKSIDGLDGEKRTVVEEAIRSLVKILRKDVYEDLKRHFLGGPSPRKNKKQNPNSPGLTSRKLQLADKTTIDYYLDQARSYNYVIRPRRILSLSSVEIPFGKKEYKINDSPIGLDVRFSGGKIIPGLTKTRMNEHIPYPASREIISRAVFWKDASGSMPNPAEFTCYGTIVLTMCVLSYLGSGAEVGVALFDEEATRLKFTRKKYEALETLCGYKGGGTYVDINRLRSDLESKGNNLMGVKDSELLKSRLFKSMVENYMRKRAMITGFDKLSKVPTDFYIVTDGGIHNIEEFIEFVRENDEYRCTIIHTSNYPLNVLGYDQQTSGDYNGITVLKSAKEQDLIELTRSILKRNLLGSRLNFLKRHDKQ